MNLSKLFAMQKVLRDRINYNKPDRFTKLILALLVELGECANEWRGFKFWSQDQKPRINKRIRCPKCQGNGWFGKNDEFMCKECDNPGGGIKTTNPLLEEYVDGLHFVLELGIEIGVEKVESFPILHVANFGIYTESNVTDQFNNLFLSVNEYLTNKNLESYEEMFLYFIGLSRHFGFTWEQIEQAYIMKNEINHQRQETGY